MFQTLINKFSKLDKLSGITPEGIMHQLFLDKEFTDLMIKLNTRDQLYDKGVNSKDERLDKIDKSPAKSKSVSQGGVYAVNTEQGIYGVFEGKIQLGLPIDRVTLFQHGDFYDSFKAYWVENENVIQIKANTIMQDGSDLIDRWGNEIIGLDENSLAVLRDFAKTRLKQIILTKLAA